MYLDRHFSTDMRSRRVEIRRLLFYIACGEVPDMENIKTHCKTKRCVNPAHAYSRSVRPDIGDMLVRGWITLDQVYEFWGAAKQAKQEKKAEA
jgi:hypothetical protein